MRLHQLDEHTDQFNDVPEVNVTEAGGYYTQPVYDMIKKHGYEKVMAELLLKLDADVIQDFLQRAEFDESVSETLSPEEKKLVAKMYNKDGTLTDLGKKVMGEGKGPHTDLDETEMMTEAQFDEAAGEKDACYRKVKARYKVWPSAYASGALTKCRKVGAANWGNSKK